MISPVRYSISSLLERDLVILNILNVNVYLRKYEYLSSFAETYKTVTASIVDIVINSVWYLRFFLSELRLDCLVNFVQRPGLCCTPVCN